jgi:hypothetical protein
MRDTFELGIGIVSKREASITAGATGLHDFKESATESYIYGYPLILSHVASQDTSRGRRTVFVPFDRELERSIGHGGQIISSTAWIDLSAEPMVLVTPADRRYYAVSLFDCWTQAFASVGVRVTGTVPRTFAIVAPSSKAIELPPKCTRIEAPSALVRIGVRIAAYSEADLPAAIAFQHRFELMTLTQFLAGERDPVAFGAMTLTQDELVKSVESMSGGEFFSMMSALIENNPLLPLDMAMREPLESLGVGLGAGRWPCNVTADTRALVERGARLGKAHIQSYHEPGTRTGSWAIDFTCEPSCGRDYLRRAAVARAQLFADVPQDYVRLIADQDSAGDPLDGRFRYSVNFDRSTEPPARGPWFVGTRPALLTSHKTVARSADGTIRLQFGRSQPAGLADAQYLPVNAGPFTIVLHVFWPDEAILNGGWLPPPIELLK